MFNMWIIFETSLRGCTAVKKSISVSMLWTNMWWIPFGFSLDIQHSSSYLLWSKRETDDLRVRKEKNAFDCKVVGTSGGLVLNYHTPRLWNYVSGTTFTCVYRVHHNSKLPPIFSLMIFQYLFLIIYFEGWGASDFSVPVCFVWMFSFGSAGGTMSTPVARVKSG